MAASKPGKPKLGRPVKDSSMVVVGVRLDVEQREYLQAQAKASGRDSISSELRWIIRQIMVAK